MNWVSMPVVIPLITALVALLLIRFPFERRLVVAVSAVLQVALAVGLLIMVAHGERLGVMLGDWAPPFGIALVVDPLSALMLVVSTLLALVVILYSLKEYPGRVEHPLRLPLIQILLCGVHLSFITGDLFNLFVAFEVMLIASYALLTIEANNRDVKWAFPYLAINLFGTALFLVAIALCYGVLGTLNFAHMAERLDMLDLTPGIHVFIILLSFVFAVKSGLFPLYFYLPNSYAILPFPLAALYAGLVTKVGIYMLFRLYGTILPHGLTLHYEIIGWIAIGTMLFGVIGAVSRNFSRGILAFHCLSQIGFIILPFAFFTLAGITASIFYLIQYILVKSTLFMIAGVATVLNRTDNLEHTGNLWRLAPWVGIIFLLQALSLAGLPPLSGFWGKLHIVITGFSEGHFLWVALAIFAGILTLFSMLKIWVGVFWKESDEAQVHLEDYRWKPLAWITAILVVPSLFLGIYAESLFELSNQAAITLLDRGGYQEFVLSQTGKGGLP